MLLEMVLFHSFLWLTSIVLYICEGFPGGSDAEDSACNVEDLGLIPGLERSREERNGNPLQYSCLENSMDKGAWWAVVHGGHKMSNTTVQLSLCLDIC